MRWEVSLRSMFKFIFVSTLCITVAAFSLGIQQKSEYASSQENKAIQGLDKVKALLEEKNFSEAEALAREILTEVEATHGADSLQSAQVLDVLVESLVGDRKRIDEGSQALIERIISIREKILGEEHSRVIQSLTDSSNLFRRTGDYTTAKKFVERALVKAEKKYGPDHVEVAKILHRIGTLHMSLYEYPKAKESLDRALMIKEKKLGPEHLEVANTLNALGELLDRMGNLDEAKSTLERVLAIREKALGHDHEQVARSLGNLANLLRTMGDYAAAKALHERALPILEKALGPDHPMVAVGLNDFGILLKDMGDYTQALHNMERALSIREKAFGEDHIIVAYSLNNVAVVLRRLRDYQRARPLLERSLAICEKTFGPENPSLAMPLNNLGNLLHNLGDYEGAGPLLKRAFEIQEKVLGSDNVNLLPYLNNYAIQLDHMGKLNEARELLQRALDIQEKNFGSDNPNAVNILINLANLHKQMGEAKEAIACIKKAKDITEKATSPTHPFMAKILRNFARFLWCGGQEDKAFENAMRSEDIVRNHLHLLTRTLSEREALAYALAESSLGLDVCFSLTVKHQDGIEGAVSRAWDAIIRSRGFILDEMAARNRSIFEISDPKVAALNDSLVKARQRLSDLMVRGHDPDASEESYQSLLEKARSEKDRAERALAQASASFREEMERNQAGLTEVRASLPPGFALVAFAYYYHNEPILEKNEQGEVQNVVSCEGEPVPSYLAFILQANDETPVVVPLGKAEEIESLFLDWRQEAFMGTRIPGRTASESEAAYRTAGEALRRRVWDPITPYLKGARSVLLVPEGSLHVVNFAALPLGSEEYLIEKGPLIHYLSAERDLVSSERSQSTGSGFLALGDPAFDETSLFAALSPEDKPKQSFMDRVKSFLPFRGSLSECEGLRSLEFMPLPATNKEIKTITDIWEKSLESRGEAFKLTGAMANEGEFKMAAPGKQILHLATHGFFLQGECQSALTSSGKQRESVAAEMEELRSVTNENPLLLTGLALAGVSHREAAGSEEEDGILTAEEIAALDLSGVDLVVLSACKSAAGRIETGEGIFGFRRAFRIAGARTLITSLWAVEDKATQEWMETFYRALLNKGKRTAESVQEASLSVLQRRREKRESTHPFYWAGFVASGDWR